MKTILVAACVAVLAGSAAARAPGGAHNTLTSAEKAAGWRLLFDGLTTAGWRGFKQPTIGGGWKVEEGVLTLADPKAAADIVTTGKYGDFELAFDWRIAPLGNSGLYYHVLEEGETGYQSGPEYQLLDNAHGEPPEQRAGALYGLYAPTTDATKPVGEFNRSRLVVRRGHVEHWLNGVKVVEYELGSPEFKAKVATTKFAAWPLFATAPTGHIALQNHGAVIGFRDIKVRPLR